MTENTRPELNEKERAVLRELFDSSAGNGHSFGYSDDIDHAGLGISRSQAAGYVSSLQQKGFIVTCGGERVNGTGPMVYQFQLLNASGVEINGNYEEEEVAEIERIAWADQPAFARDDAQVAKEEPEVELWDGQFHVKQPTVDPASKEVPGRGLGGDPIIQATRLPEWVPNRDNAHVSDYVQVLLTDGSYSDPIFNCSSILDFPEDIPNIHPDALTMLTEKWDVTTVYRDHHGHDVAILSNGPGATATATKHVVKVREHGSDHEVAVSPEFTKLSEAYDWIGTNDYGREARKEPVVIRRQMLDAELRILEFAAEASDLGLKPGEVPKQLTTDLGNGEPFILVNASSEVFRYQQANGCISLVVFND